MNTEKKLKVILIILLIILISIISFGGIFIQKGKLVENILPEYLLGMDFKGGRFLKLVVSDETKEVIYDKNGNVVTEEGDNTTKKNEPINSKENLTKENYNKTENVIKKRLNGMGVTNYTTRLNEKDGTIFIQIPENTSTDTIAQYTATKGNLEFVGENDEVLLTQEHIKSAQAATSSSTSGVSVHLIIEFDEEGKEALKNITSTYVKTVDADGKEQEKKIDLKLDNSTLFSTSFDETIENGIFQLTVGQASKTTETLNNYITEASNMAALLDNGSLPLTYTIDENRYVQSDITLKTLLVPLIIIDVLFVIAFVMLIIRYGKNGLLGVISLIGYIAVLLLLVRFCNVTISLEGVAGLFVSVALNYAFTIYVLHLIKHNKNDAKSDELNSYFNNILLKSLAIIIPVAITMVVTSFAGVLPVYSFGLVMFWGIFAGVVYDFAITKTLIISCKK